MEDSTFGSARILVVDDEPGMREGCRRVLTSIQHEVDVAENLAGARQQIAQNSYDLVLIDVMMPDGNGIDLMRPIHERDPDTICIVITGYASVETAVDAVKQGAYDFISKPFSSDQLIFAVNQGLERRRLRHEAAQLDACRRRADELAESKAELEKLERVKSQFMLTVAHELRAPVAAIQSYLNLILADYVSDAELKPTLTRAHRRLQELLDLIADLLELARLKQARDLAPAEAKPQPVADILEEVVELLREQAHQKAQKLHVAVRARPEIVGARSHMRQIWMNLISNAIKYTPRHGKVSVRLDVSDGQAVGVVEDSGIGIAAEDLPCLFQEFYRTEQAKASGEIGTGLGLAIVKQITTAYGGDIQVSSTLGKGTRFTVTLPLERQAEPAEPEPPAPGGRPPYSGTHTRVLGLSDDPQPGSQ